MNIPTKIKELKGDMSYEEMAKFIEQRTGVEIHWTTLQKWVKGYRVPRVGMLRIIDEAFNSDTSFEGRMDKLIEEHGIGKMLHYLADKTQGKG